MVNLAGNRQQDRLLAQAVSVAERSAEVALLRYQEGFSDYQRVLSAQQALFSQQARYVTNRGDLVRSAISLYRALGGGWRTQHQNLPLIDADTRRTMEQRTDWNDLIEATELDVRNTDSAP